MKKELDDRCYNMSYNFSSALDEDISMLEHTAFINDYCVSIHEADETGLNNIKEIGRINFYVILNNSARNNDYSIFELYDGDSEYLYRLFSQIFVQDEEDEGNYVLNELITDFYGGDGCVDSILFLKKIEIIESHRGMNIGGMAIKDIIRRFPSVDLIVGHPCPLQFDAGRKKGDENWEREFNINSLPKNKKISKYYLDKFYTNLGFKIIKGIEGGVMFINPK